MVGGAELLHHVELGVGAAEVAREGRRGDGLEVAERLVEVDRQAELLGEAPDLAGRER